jgi:hypothetical protein
VARGARFLALIALPLLLACGGGGGGGSSPTQPQAEIVFTPTSTGPGIVLAQGGTTTASNLVLEVRAAQVSGLYGVAFDLDYPSNVLHFSGYHAGSFLAANGVQVSTQVAETTPGHLVVGVSRLGSTTSGVDGSGVLLELDLAATAAGTGNFAFTRNGAYHSDGSGISLAWAAGSVAVTR